VRHRRVVLDLELDQQLADGDDRALGCPQCDDRAGDWGGDLDRRLVGLDLEEHRVLLDGVALRDEPRQDLALGDAFAEVREREPVPHQNSRVRRTASAIRSGEGR
jgi:hypothetical protein